MYAWGTQGDLIAVRADLVFDAQVGMLHYVHCRSRISIRVFFSFVFLSTTGFDSDGWGGRSGAGGAGAGEIVVLLEECLSGGAGLGCVYVDC